jgi:Rv2525c-like, glycoside hydrolase-like domain
MRWSSSGPTLPPRCSRRKGCNRVAIAAVAAGLAVGLASIGSARATPAASRAGKATMFTGYAFDACNAPKPETLQAWLASPYRALGVYIGGANRACANARLSPDWVAGAVAGGWSLIPIYVGLQAPCVSKAGVARIDPSAAAAQGTEAADDAVTDSTLLALPSDSPIYLDMEGYALDKPVCTLAVQAFVTSWVNELHAQGYLAGVYGSAASTIRDMQALTATTSAPDDVWIADWNGRQDVFGDPYVADSFWANHQRLHQYRGAHRETWGGITVDVDSSVVDGAVVGATGSAPPPVIPSPSPTPAPGQSAAGSLSADDGVSDVSWPAGAFQRPVIVSLLPTQPSPPAGFGTGGYEVQLQVQTTGSQPATGFSQPLTIHIGAMPGSLAPMTSSDGSSWRPLTALASSALPAGTTSGFVRNGDGSIDVLTTAPGYFALFPELARPSAPAELTGRFSHGQLLLRWPTSTSPSGPAVSYQVTLTNHPVLTLPTTTAAVGTIHHTTPSVYRVVATDAAGKTSEPSKPLVVLPSRRPKNLPKAIPHWAFELAAWQQGGKAGPRPNAPRIVPAWYWRWEAWYVAPFHIRA